MVSKDSPNPGLNLVRAGINGPRIAIYKVDARFTNCPAVQAD